MTGTRGWAGLVELVAGLWNLSGKVKVRGRCGDAVSGTWRQRGACFGGGYRRVSAVRLLHRCGGPARRLERRQRCAGGGADPPRRGAGHQPDRQCRVVWQRPQREGRGECPARAPRPVADRNQGHHQPRPGGGDAGSGGSRAAAHPHGRGGEPAASRLRPHRRVSTPCASPCRCGSRRDGGAHGPEAARPDPPDRHLQQRPGRDTPARGARRRGRAAGGL